MEKLLNMMKEILDTDLGREISNIVEGKNSLLTISVLSGIVEIALLQQIDASSGISKEDKIEGVKYSQELLETSKIFWESYNNKKEDN